MEYFGEGQLKKTTAKTGADVDLERIVNDVDGLGRPLSEDTTGTTASASRSFAYSAGGGVFTTTITGPRDTTIIETDGAGRRTRLKNGLADVSYMLDGNDNVEHIMSDEDGPLVFKQDFTYDGLDHALTQGDGVGPRGDVHAASGWHVYECHRCAREDHQLRLQHPRRSAFADASRANRLQFAIRRRADAESDSRWRDDGQSHGLR
jgi:hypothetical protein